MPHVRDELEPRPSRLPAPARKPEHGDRRIDGPVRPALMVESLQRSAGNAAVSQFLERAHVAQRQVADDEETETAPGTTEKMPDFLNPEPLPEGAEAGPTTPKPGESGEAESVVYEITVMQPLRAALSAVDTQDWDVAYDQLKGIGLRLMDYQNAYEKSDPLLYSQLQAARGWLGTIYGQLGRRLNRDTWSDKMIADRMRENVGMFEEVGPKLH